jgi:hypothetical protein
MAGLVQVDRGQVPAAWHPIWREHGQDGFLWGCWRRAPASEQPADHHDYDHVPGGAGPRPQGRFPRSANYLDLKADHAKEYFKDPSKKNVVWTALKCREQFPEIVVQVDSLLNLRPEGIGEVAPFDLVIFDMVASILAHLFAATLRNGMETSDMLLEIVQREKRVLVMDDGYGQWEHDFFRLANVQGKLVINARRAAVGAEGTTRLHLIKVDNASLE